MDVLWKHLFARFKSRLSYDDFASIAGFYLRATSRNEPFVAFELHMREGHPSVDVVAESFAVLAPRLKAIATEPDRASQARSCRVLLREYAERSATDHYLALKTDEVIRGVYLAAIHSEATPEDLERRETELIPNYFYSIDVTLCSLYQEQFDRFMSVDAFHKQYHAMVEMNVRILCAKLFSQMMEEHGDAEKKKVSEFVRKRHAPTCI